LNISGTRDPDGYWRISELASVLNGAMVAVGADAANVKGKEICIDSRKVGKGDIFVALVGKNTDGELFAEEALRSGASAVICKRGGSERIGASGVYIEVGEVDRSLLDAAAAVRLNGKFKVVGITGSVGKTTVKELCINVLSAAYPTDGTKGNLNNELGVPLTVLNAFGVDKMREIRGKYPNNTQKYLVLEMGISHTDEMEILGKVALTDIAVVTNIGNMHLEGLGSRAGIAREKCRMVQSPQCVVFFDGDALVKNELVGRMDCRAVAVTFDKENNKRAFSDMVLIKNMRSATDLSLAKFDLEYVDIDGKIEVLSGITAPIVGIHGVYDTALAILVGLNCGVDRELLKSAVRSYSPCGMRQQMIRHRGTVRMVDCYNSGPESLKAAFDAVNIYSDRLGCSRRVAVLGSMLELGALSEDAHIALGEELVRQGFELLFTVGKEARGFAVGALRGGLSVNSVFSFEEDDSFHFIETFIESRIRAGDIILYKASRGIGLERLIHLS